VKDEGILSAFFEKEAKNSNRSPGHMGKIFLL
jgi:hypothetical protein